eukprot:GFUD01031803.1.p1 GENE.GFUD01031803.1~~GFUD01031803.1.p1  ORF type:complete len:193 (-),score=44.20 GFUD01031803.1:35-613(-)
MLIDELDKANSFIGEVTIDGNFKKVTNKYKYCEENIRKGNRKGILWQQTDKLFSSWEERFFVLPEHSLYSFSRETNQMEKLDKAVSKIKLSDMSDLSLMDKKGQLLIVIVTKKFGKIFLRKPKGLKDWYEQILENVSAIKFTNQRRKLQTSISLNIQDKHKSKALMIPLHRPLMGISSLMSVKPPVKAIEYF